MPYKSKDKKNEYDKQYYQKNKQKRNEYRREHQQQNREKYNEYNRQYRGTEKGIKKSRINMWKKRGIICFDWEFLYDIYIHCDTCDFCHNHFKNTADRCLDHDHSITDDMNIRGILCRSCNSADKLKD